MSIRALLIATLLAAAGCATGVYEPGPGGDADADADTDSDTDSDADADTDADSECEDPSPGAPTVTSSAAVQLATAATSGTYALTFSEDVLDVDELTVTWTATSGGGGTLDAITPVDAATYQIGFSGVAYGETYEIAVGTAVTDLCGTPLAAEFTVSVGWAPLSCPLPNGYSSGIPFSTGSYNDDEYCTSGDSSYHFWDLSALGAVAICLSGSYDTESCCDEFYVKDGAGSILYTGYGSGSYTQLVDDDQAITCVYSDYSITYTGYTITGITWI